eukprot:TRINITY_DN7589_c0_g1_i2.p1 TRINITY_DN7589_c0_g1~~TRINITY_DN7589_c0_g1_i2.p1  ORF type:complete len:580 (-),score=96.68 TRINITY_DN7589_c0_g1_i2:63-1802(-)
MSLEGETETPPEITQSLPPPSKDATLPLKSSLNAQGQKVYQTLFKKNYNTVFLTVYLAATILSWGWEVSTRDPTQNKLILFIFHRLLGLTFVTAFISNWVQAKGLIGEKGILPMKETLKLFERFGSKSKLSFPTVFWFNSSDQYLQYTCGVGLLTSVLYTLNILSPYALLVSCICHCSLKVVGREFYALQFDNLLLDTGFFALLTILPSALPFPTGYSQLSSNFYDNTTVWLLRWLLFRLMFSSGLCKIVSRDPVWRSGMALKYHYWTQPMPNKISWYANQLPLSVHKISCWAHFVVEIALPFAVFVPYGKIAFWSCLGLIGLQVAILATGNYGFFNILSILLPLLLLDDKFVPQFLANAILPLKPEYIFSTASIFGLVLAVLSLALFSATIALSLIPLAKVTKFSAKTILPSTAYKMYALLAPFGILNYYGLFARMTTGRKEILIQGSNDLKEWKEYEFIYKAGDVKKTPYFVIGHLPRLDWRMWFCQFEYFSNESLNWFDSFLEGLLKGNNDILDLLEKNPFKESPPRFIKCMKCDYVFASPEEKKEGNFWSRASEPKLYWPIVTLKNNQMCYLLSK